MKKLVLLGALALSVLSLPTVADENIGFRPVVRMPVTRSSLPVCESLSGLFRTQRRY
ncbi:hypothetical protein [Pseudomonas piscis]|uniref:hypothetical protein n=1 Tax=Pseudomonas piscis TaxID=2614538 RepID=UPI0003B69592|nr:hypothetical protein [Pseudomonas piscis]ERO64443.1 hypothetical protein P308_24135 [Pseudomonas piscis]